MEHHQCLNRLENDIVCYQILPPTLTGGAELFARYWLHAVVPVTTLTTATITSSLLQSGLAEPTSQIAIKYINKVSYYC
jgi:hypothetical protein